MNYGIFRNGSIMTINDLVQIESHNKREKKLSVFEERLIFFFHFLNLKN